jgi:cold shock CspA family protein
MEKEVFRGKISIFNKDKFYGFLKEVETGKEFFYHGSEVKGELPAKGDEVNFRIGVYNKRACAESVTKIQ